MIKLAQLALLALAMLATLFSGVGFAFEGRKLRKGTSAMKLTRLLIFGTVLLVMCFAYACGKDDPSGSGSGGGSGGTPKMYWTDALLTESRWTDGKIQRANLDGSNVEDLITTGLNAPWASRWMWAAERCTGRTRP